MNYNDNTKINRISKSSCLRLIYLRLKMNPFRPSKPPPTGFDILATNFNFFASALSDRKIWKPSIPIDICISIDLNAILSIYWLSKQLEGEGQNWNCAVVFNCFQRCCIFKCLLHAAFGQLVLLTIEEMFSIWLHYSSSEYFLADIKTIRKLLRKRLDCFEAKKSFHFYNFSLANRERVLVKEETKWNELIIFYVQTQAVQGKDIWTFHQIENKNFYF